MTAPEEPHEPPARIDSGGGFSVLDGLALVLGAAVASIHTRELVAQRLTGSGWTLVWLTFAGITLSAAGPFVFLARRFGRRPAGYPRAGDWLWSLIGMPWVLAALAHPATAAVGRVGGRPDSNRLAMQGYSLFLGGCIAVASLTALGVIWRTWVLVPPEAIREREPPTWTERIGLILAVAWPIQCGFGLVVLG